MAKLQGPLFSFAASGTYGKTITFRNTGHGFVAHSHNKGHPMDGPVQQLQKERFNQARQAWQGVDSEDRARWKSYASRKGRPAFAAYFAEYCYQRCQPGQQPLIPQGTESP